RGKTEQADRGRVRYEREDGQGPSVAGDGEDGGGIPGGARPNGRATEPLSFGRRCGAGAAGIPSGAREPARRPTTHQPEWKHWLSPTDRRKFARVSPRSS